MGGEDKGIFKGFFSCVQPGCKSIPLQAWFWGYAWLDLLSIGLVHCFGAWSQRHCGFPVRGFPASARPSLGFFAPAFSSIPLKPTGEVCDSRFCSHGKAEVGCPVGQSHMWEGRNSAIEKVWANGAGASCVLSFCKQGLLMWPFLAWLKCSWWSGLKKEAPQKIIVKSNS